MINETSHPNADTSPIQRPATVAGVTSAALPVNSQDRFVHIDAMRAVAVLLVVVMHSGLTFFPGDSGVTVFFAISGFIITFILIKERARTGGFRASGFYYRRLLKLAPPFILIVAIPTFIFAFFQPISWVGFGSQVLFTFNWIEIYAPAQAAETLPGTSVVWSLAVEEQFYIVFALIWILLVKRTWWLRGLVIVSVLAIAISFVTRWLVAADMPMHAMRGTDSRMEAIAWGVLAATALSAHRNGRLSRLAALGSPWVVLIAAVLYGASFAIPDGWAELVFRPTLWAISAILVILFGMLPRDSTVKDWFFRIVSSRPIQIIGLASYSIYLIHFELRAVILAIIPEDFPVPLTRLAIIVAGLVGGIAVYYLVEVPSSRLRHFPMRSAAARRAQRAS